MIKFCPLYSGSKGNSYYIKIDTVEFLVDIGKSAKKITEALAEIGVDSTNISAVFITHEHTDHISGLKVFTKKNDVKVFLTNKTKKVLEENLIYVKEENQITFKRGEKFEYMKVKVKSFKTSHDAIEPCGFSFWDNAGNKLTIVTDLGNVDDTIIENVKGSNILLIESNYEEKLLQLAPYPPYLKSRILSEYGHLSNKQAKALLKEVIDLELKHLYIGHISENSNTEKIVELEVKEVLKELKIDIPFKISSKDKPTESVEI